MRFSNVAGVVAIAGRITPGGAQFPLRSSVARIAKTPSKFNDAAAAEPMGSFDEVGKQKFFLMEPYFNSGRDASHDIVQSYQRKTATG
jgi:hypothetical protein